MKRMSILIGLVLSLLLLLAPVASARHWRRWRPSPSPIPAPAPSPTPTPLPSPIVGKLYGVNYANYDLSVMPADIVDLKAAGVQGIRTYIPDFDGNEITMTRNIALLAKQNGFVVTWGVCTSGYTNQTRWANFLNSVNAQAKWANDNGIHYFTIGNEEELHATFKSKSQVQADIRNKAAEIKKLYPNLKLTYAAAAYQEDVNAWLANTGSLDTIGLNVYVNFPNLVKQIAGNPKGVISEWNTDAGSNVNSLSKWSAELILNRDIINSYNVKAYLFVVRGRAGGDLDHHSVTLGSGSPRLSVWQALIK